MKIVFMGTPAYAAIILEQLAAAHEVVGVFTNEDKVRGRGSALEPTAVKVCAEALGLQVFTPRSLRAPEVQAQLAALCPEVICVAAYGKILPQEVLDIPPHGCLNVHASLLPRWRGAAPIQRAILAGDAHQGVSIMQMEAGLDTGAYTNCCVVDAGELGAADLTEELARRGAEALVRTLAQVEAGTVSWTAQDEALVTYADKIARHELDICACDTVETVLRKVRAADAAHPAKCIIDGRCVALVEARRAGVAGAECVPCGQARVLAKTLLLGCADGCVEVVLVKPDGKGRMEGRAFAAGIPNAKCGVTCAYVSEGAAAGSDAGSTH